MTSTELLQVARMHWDGHMWGGGFWLLTGVLFLLLVVALVGFVVWLVVRASSGTQAPPGAGGSRARALLDERYARGEISTEEYQERRQALE
jgi:putative membrane protein